jgi:hypothetical protein
MNSLADIFKRTSKPGPEQEGSSHFEKANLHLPVVQAETIATILARKDVLTPEELMEILSFLSGLENSSVEAMKFAGKIPSTELHLNNKSTNPKFNLIARRRKSANEVVIDQQKENITSRITFSEGLAKSNLEEPRVVIEDSNIELSDNGLSSNKATKTSIKYYSEGNLMLKVPQYQRVVIVQDVTGPLGQGYGEVQTVLDIRADRDNSITTSFKTFNADPVVFSYNEYSQPVRTVHR